MLSDQQKPKLSKCPQCGGKLSDIIYGLPSGPPAEGEILGGCIIDNDSPSHACSQCDWEGTLAGQEFDIQSSDVWKKWSEHEKVFVYYDKELKQIAQVAHFMVQGNHHMFLFLRPGFSEWQSAFTLEEFSDAIATVQKPLIEVWAIETPDDAPIEVFNVEPSNYGSPAIQACIDAAVVETAELLMEGNQFLEPIFWPQWFDPEIMVSCW